MSQSSPDELGTDNQEKLLPVQGVAEQEAKPSNPPNTSAMRKRLKPASKVIHKMAPQAPQVKILSCHKDKCLTYIHFLITITITIALVVALAVVASRGCESCCPDGWVGYQRKCYNFSEAEGNWADSQSQCSALGASLAGIDSLQELTFLMRRKGRDYHWIGLQREGVGQPWKWVNGTEFNNLFNVTGGADCAYLNDVTVSSSRCLTMKKWICSKPSLH